MTLVDECYVSISYTASAGMDTLLAFASNDIAQFFSVFLKRKQGTQAQRKKRKVNWPKACNLCEKRWSESSELDFV